MAIHPKHGNISTVRDESFLVCKSSVRERKKKSRLEVTTKIV
jgi:hypothetical protein